MALMSGVSITIKRRLQRMWYLSSSFAVTMILLFAVLLITLRLFGFQMFTVTSGSMEPHYPVGSLIYTTPVDVSNIKEGDVITFMNNEKTVVTHRVTEILTEIDNNGITVTRFRTKGDANNSADSKLVHEKNIIGAPIVTIPLFGYVSFYLQRPPGLYFALIVGTFLVTLIIIPYITKPKGKEQTTQAQI